MGISDPMFSGDVVRRVAELERQLRNLTSGRRLEDASVGARGITVRDGGSITIDGGTLKLIDENGVTVAYWGDVNFGGLSRGWVLNFDSGHPAFALGGTPGQQAWQLWDGAGHYIVTNDAASGVGLARPYLNIPMVPSHGTSIGTGGPFWPEFTNTSFQEVMYRITSLWHPKISFGVNTNTSSGTVDWELRVDGVTAGSGSGDGAGVFNVPGWGTTILPGDQRSVQLWCRNTTGTASRAVVDRCYGTQS
jgi:hypothetical protein